MPKPARPSLGSALAVKSDASYSPAAVRAEVAAGREPVKRLNVNVPEGLYERFKERADAEGHSLTWLVLRFVEQYAEEGRAAVAPR
ncbi:MAG: hypothetical protein LCH53_14275 [Bacteroidetes bacterium]|nr:hypothetical protein [Bacteroidota bacterium]